eukprot:3557184-Rhodomonas_salina.2
MARKTLRTPHLQPEVPLISCWYALFSEKKRCLCHSCQRARQRWKPGVEHATGSKRAERGMRSWLGACRSWTVRDTRF